MPLPAPVMMTDFPENCMESSLFCGQYGRMI